MSGFAVAPGAKVFQSTFTRATTDGSGTIDVTGFGFQPKLFYVIAGEDAGPDNFSGGFGNSGFDADIFNDVTPVHQKGAHMFLVNLTNGFRGTFNSFLSDGIRLNINKLGGGANMTGHFFAVG